MLDERVRSEPCYIQGGSFPVVGLRCAKALGQGIVCLIRTARGPGGWSI